MAYFQIPCDLTKYKNARTLDPWDCLKEAQFCMKKKDYGAAAFYASHAAQGMKYVQLVGRQAPEDPAVCSFAHHFEEQARETYEDARTEAFEDIKSNILSIGASPTASELTLSLFDPHNMILCLLEQEYGTQHQWVGPLEELIPDFSEIILPEKKAIIGEHDLQARNPPAELLLDYLQKRYLTEIVTWVSRG